MKIKGKNKTVNILLLLFAALVVVFLIKSVNIQSVDEYYLEHIDDITPESMTVTMSIRCDTVLENYDDLDDSLKSEQYIPPDGVILPVTEYVLREGDTVFSVLSRAVRHEHIQTDFQGADQNRYGTVYIRSINYLYEFSCGPQSGWMYRVNGEFPNVGCSDFKLKDGDVIEWVYTCDLGRDVGCGFEK